MAERKVNTSLEKIDLGINRIGDEGVKELAEALKANTTLENISLGIKIGAKGAKHLAEALKENNSLEKIDLGENDIGAKGVKELAEALKVNTTLENIWLGVITSVRKGEVFGGGVESEYIVEEVHLGWNDIGAEGAKHLAEALKSTTLENILLGENEIALKEQNIWRKR